MTREQEIEFNCPAPGCGEPIRFNLRVIEDGDPQIPCPACGKTHRLSPEAIRKLGLLQDLIVALRKARPILGEGGVGVEVGEKKVVVPYYLLLTRMTSELALKVDDAEIAFRFVVES